MTSDLEELEAKMAEPSFWNDTRAAASLSRKKVTLERELSQWREMDAKISDLQALLDLAEESLDDSLEQELTAELQQFEPELAALHVEMLLSGELDPNNAIVAIHPNRYLDNDCDMAWRIRIAPFQGLRCDTAGSQGVALGWHRSPRWGEDRMVESRADDQADLP